MSFRIRAARTDDFTRLYNLAKLTGGGFTNLPAEKATFKAKLERSEAGFRKAKDEVGDDLYLFMLENVGNRQIRGTCQIFGAVGTNQPFYSYLISTLTQRSKELGRVFRNQTLNLTTDLEGSSEVGGLFLHPNERAGGLGLLLARSRYMFIRKHRARFGDTVLAELRGVMDDAGNSPFWDAIGGRFFGLSFPEADEFNAVHGTQFIADLFPMTPIYVAMLPDNAQAAMGQPHPSGRAALEDARTRMLRMGRLCRHFRRRPDGHCATPTRSAPSSEGARGQAFEGPAEGGETMLLAAGELHEFRACYGEVQEGGDGTVAIDAKAQKDAWSRSRRDAPDRSALMAIREINFDGIVGPSHNYAGLSLGNLASARNAGETSYPRAAALQGVAKMRSNLALGLVQGLFVPPPRPATHWLGALGTDFEEADRCSPPMR